jgi:hypothetical protein
VRANVDSPEDARRARVRRRGRRALRTEHIAADRQPKMRAMFMVDDEAGRRAGAPTHVQRCRELGASYTQAAKRKNYR